MHAKLQTLLAGFTTSGRKPQPKAIGMRVRLEAILAAITISGRKPHPKAIGVRVPLKTLLAAVTAVYAPTAAFAQGPVAMQSSASDHAGTDTIPTGILNSRQFEIPFSVDQFGVRPLEIQLYVSRDQGRHWSLFGRQGANGREFKFTAPDDGTYWFATRTIDATGTPHPAGTQIAPQLRVTVDTAKPELSLEAEADAAGRVIVDYAYVDDSTAAGDLQLQYMTDTDRTQWFTVPAGKHPLSRDADGTRRGRIEFDPEGNWRYLHVRLIASDQAGNQATVTRQVEKPRMAGTRAQLASAPQVRLPSPSAPGEQQAPPAEIPTASDGGYQLRMPEPQPYAHRPQPQISYAPQRDAADGALLPGQTTNPYVDSHAGGAAPAYRGFGSPSGPTADGPARWSPGVGAQTVSQPSPLARSSSGAPSSPSSRPALAPPLGSGAPPAPNEMPAAAMPPNSKAGRSDAASQAGPISPSSAMRPLEIETLPTPAGERDESHPVNISASPRPAEEAPTALPPTSVDESEIRQSRSRQFSLDYEVESVGSKGIQAVELWGSSDDGRSWSNWGSDPDNQSPFDIETMNSGVYGFRIVVVGGNGLTSPRPQPGDEADIYVRIDTDAPRVGLTAARYGEGEEAGSLVIEYRCEDENLAARPVSLSFSESPDGPWTTIATGLENTGRYAWPADPRLPRQVYLRIEAVDRAGNVGTEARDTPIAVQGLAPRAKIRGFQSIAP